MNTLDDLRRTLDTHAADASGVDAGVDTSALHDRIRRARRRRTTARGGVALAAVVAVASAAFLPGLLPGDDGAPASREERTVLGQVAPATKSALGLTYTWESAAAAEDGTSVSVEPTTASEPPLLTWTTSDPDAQVTVTDAEDTLLWTSRTGGFADHVVLDHHPELPVTVTSSEPGVAVVTYAFDPDGPVDGHREGGVIFPRQIGDRRLVATAVSDRGDAEVSVQVPTEATRGGQQISIAKVCVGFEQDAGASTSVDGDELTSGGRCNADPGVVHGTDASFELTGRIPSSGTFSARAVRMTEDGDNTDEPVDEPQGRVALAVYVSDLPDVTFHDLPQPRTQVWGGHLWELAGSANGTETSTADDLDRTTQWLATAVLVAPEGTGEEQAGEMDVAVAADGREVQGPKAHFVGLSGRNGVSTGPTLLPLGTRSATVPDRYVGDGDEYQLLAWRLVG